VVVLLKLLILCTIYGYALYLLTAFMPAWYTSHSCRAAVLLNGLPLCMGNFNAVVSNLFPVERNLKLRVQRLNKPSHQQGLSKFVG